MDGAEIDGGAAEIGRFLTVSDVADELCLSASETFEIIRSGALPAVRLGNGTHWRVERSALEDYIEAVAEENRRAGLWQQAQYADVTELSFDPRR